MRKADLSFFLPYQFRRLAYRFLAHDAFDRLTSLVRSSDGKGYSVGPYFESKCIFVHVPKTAGISVCQALFGNSGGGHTTLGEYQVIFKKPEFDVFFKFAFVRNPWDRVYSAYRFLKKGGMNDKDRAIRDKYFCGVRDFREFVLNLSGNDGLMRYEHFRPQSEFIVLPFKNRIILNYVGLYERIHDDFKEILVHLGRDSRDELPRRNVSEKISDGGYMSAYDEDTMRIVGGLYAQDVNLLGYTFDNSNLEDQVRYMHALGLRG